MIPHNVLIVCKSNATFRPNIQNVLTLVSGISYSISSHCVLSFDLVLVNLGKRMGCSILKMKWVFQ